MTKRKRIILICIAFIIIMIITAVCGTVLYKEWKKKEEKYQAELKILYEHANFALGMKAYDSYKDFSYVDVNSLIMKLAAYKHFNSDVEISIDDVKNFLSSECDEKGEPYVLNPPENISNYIMWYVWRNGDYLTTEYYIFLSRFQDDNVDKYPQNAYILDEDLLNELIEDFENCPNKEDYEIY